MFSRLVDQINDLVTFVIVALIFGLVRVVMMPGVKSITTYLLSMAVSVPVGTIAGALCLEFGFGDMASIAMASLASLLAHDLLTGIMNNKDFLGSLIKRAAENLTDRLTK